MGIHILHLVRVQTRIFQRMVHGTARTVHVRCGHVVGVGTHAKTRQFGINVGAACLGMLVFL